MKAENRIVFLEGNFPAIFFPIGRPGDGGSCAYMTDHCQQYCPCHDATNPHEHRALRFFVNNDVRTIRDRILEEICSEGLMHLYWWPWGDCLPKLTNKIHLIMCMLAAQGVLQNGFTRNLELFELISEEHEDLKIGYHAETEKEAKTIAPWKVTCFPDVNTGKGVLYKHGRIVAKCCGIWCEWVEKKEIRIADCQECFLYKEGCFYEKDLQLNQKKNKL